MLKGQTAGDECVQNTGNEKRRSLSAIEYDFVERLTWLLARAPDLHRVPAQVVLNFLYARRVLRRQAQRVTFGLGCNHTPQVHDTILHNDVLRKQVHPGLRCSIECGFMTKILPPPHLTHNEL